MLRPPPRPRQQPAQKPVALPGLSHKGSGRRPQLSRGRHGADTGSPWTGAGGPRQQPQEGGGVRKYNIRINVQLARARSLGELFAIIEHEAVNFNAVNASTALHRIAKVQKRCGRFLLYICMP